MNKSDFTYHLLVTIVWLMLIVPIAYGFYAIFLRRRHKPNIVTLSPEEREAADLPKTIKVIIDGQEFERETEFLSFKTGIYTCTEITPKLYEGESVTFNWRGQHVIKKKRSGRSG